MQVGTYFFFWHNCPIQSCNQARIYAAPPGWNEPLPGDADSRDGLYYSSRNVHWYLQELRDMRLAGIEIVLPVSWGDSRLPWFRTALLRNLVEANRQLDPPMRIGLFDDTTSEVREYRDFADNQRFDYSGYSETGIPLDLSDPRGGFFFYDRKIRPFFQLVPQEMWATHDGRPVEEGGRPIIVVYTTEGVTHLEHAGALWAGIKEAFQQDFRDYNGRPITPWVVLESTWFTEEALNATPSLVEVVDGQYVWGSALFGIQVRDWESYTVTSLGPGFDDRKYWSPQPGREQPRYQDPEGNTGDPGTFFQWNLDQIPPRTDLLLIETWNELYEGTNVSRAAFPLMREQFVPEDFYMDLLRRALRAQGLWWAAQPLAPSWPPQLIAQQDYRLTLLVQNTGTRTWTTKGGEYLELSSDFIPDLYRSLPEQPVNPGGIGQFTFDIRTPIELGYYSLDWQMYGPEGPFGPPVNWIVSVGGTPLTTTLIAEVPKTPPHQGDLFSVTVKLQPPLVATEVHLQVRFDPETLHLHRMQPLPGHRGRRWQVQVDNDLGTGRIEASADEAEDISQAAQLELEGLLGGEAGFWIEEAVFWVEDGVALVLGPQWVPLTIQPAP
jgi:hypothetical protein